MARRAFKFSELRLPNNRCQCHEFVRPQVPLGIFACFMLNGMNQTKNRVML